jgi:predicted ATPase
VITDLEVSGFKGLEKVKLAGLRRLNLIAGQNNTGKTSILEALFMSLDLGNPELLTRHTQWRGVDSLYLDANSAWGPVFFGFKVTEKNAIQVKTRLANGERNIFTAMPEVTPSQAGSAQGVKTRETINIRSIGQPRIRLTYTRASKTIFDATVSLTGGAPPFHLKPTKFTEKPTTAVYVLARQRPSDDATNFGRIDEARGSGPIVDALKLMEPRLVGLSVVPIGSTSQVFADIKGLSKKVPLNFLGDGMSRLLTILINIVLAKDGYAFVDEIENGFHYSVLPGVFRVIYSICKEQRCQLFATTHSQDCINAISKLEDDFRFIRLERDDKNSLITSEFDPASLREAVASNWETR